MKNSFNDLKTQLSEQDGLTRYTETERIYNSKLLFKTIQKVLNEAN